MTATPSDFARLVHRIEIVRGFRSTDPNDVIRFFVAVVIVDGQRLSAWDGLDYMTAVFIADDLSDAFGRAPVTDFVLADVLAIEGLD